MYSKRYTPLQSGITAADIMTAFIPCFPCAAAFTIHAKWYRDALAHCDSHVMKGQTSMCSCVCKHTRTKLLYPPQRLHHNKPGRLQIDSCACLSCSGTATLDHPTAVTNSHGSFMLEYPSSRHCCGNLNEHLSDRVQQFGHKRPGLVLSHTHMQISSNLVCPAVLTSICVR